MGLFTQVFQLPKTLTSATFRQPIGVAAGFFLGTSVHTFVRGIVNGVAPGLPRLPLGNTTFGVDDIAALIVDGIVIGFGGRLPIIGSALTGLGISGWSLGAGMMAGTLYGKIAAAVGGLPTIANVGAVASRQAVLMPSQAFAHFTVA